MLNIFLMQSLATSLSPDDCHHNLTSLMNFLLDDKVSPLLAPWLCGAHLTALLKKNGVPFLLLLMKFCIILLVTCAVSLLDPIFQIISFLVAK